MNQKSSTKSIRIYQCLILLGFSIIIGRLFWIQIIQHSKYSTLAEHNRIRIEALQATRGKILDRHGIILAENRTSFQLIYQHLPTSDITKELPYIQTCLSHYTDIQPSPNQSVISRRLTSHELSCLAFYDDQTPSFHLEPRHIRSYPFGKVTSHLLGYMAPPTQNQLNSLNTLERKAIVNMGRSGIEVLYEKKLRGTPGWKQQEVNARGRQIREMDQIEPVAGDNITLTLDSQLQTLAYSALGDHIGAFIILDPNDGSLLALASTPSFNANDFSYGIPSKLFTSLIEDPQKPLYHRATHGLYPPASIIKPFYALAALEEGVVTASESIQDKGWFTLENSKHVFHDWRRAGHGVVDLERAISVSCDTYFYRLSTKMGIKRMEKWLHIFGFGESIAKPLTSRSGLVPSPEWKKSRKQIWTAGDTVITGIGQGSLLVTPIQAALALSRVASKGMGYRLRLNLHDTPEPLQAISAQDSSWEHVIRGMTRVITDSDGTAWRMKSLKMDIAAKTGTAQVVSLDHHKGKKQHRDHNWFVGFTPAENPKIVFVVLIEHEHVASKVAAEFLKKWNELQTNPQA